MKKNTLYWIIAILIMFNVVTLYRMNDLEDSINSRFQQYGNIESNLRGDISQIYSRVDAMLKKQASILDSYDLVLGELNPDSLTVPVTFTITPKEYSDKLTASLQINDKSFDMQRNGTTFSVAANASIFGDFKLKINLSESGITKTETIEEYYGLQSKYLLEIFGGFGGESSASSTNYQYHGEINIDIKTSQANEPVKVNIITEVNGKILSEKSVSPSRAIHVPVDEKINFKTGDKLIVYAKIQDKYGLNYKYVLLDQEAADDKKENHFDLQGTLEISDMNGNILLDKSYQDKR